MSKVNVAEIFGENVQNPARLALVLQGFLPSEDAQYVVWIERENGTLVGLDRVENGEDLDPCGGDMAVIVTRQTGDDPVSVRGGSAEEANRLRDRVRDLGCEVKDLAILAEESFVSLSVVNKMDGDFYGAVASYDYARETLAQGERAHVAAAPASPYGSTGVSEDIGTDEYGEDDAEARERAEIDALSCEEDDEDDDLGF